MKKLVIFVDKRSFGFYNVKSERIIINWLKKQMRRKG